MAQNWQIAQAREREFWDQIYVRGSQDIATYQPIDDLAAVAFAIKCFYRHKFNPLACEGKAIVDLGCGPYGVIKGLTLLNHGQFARIVGVDPLMDHYRSYGVLQNTGAVELIQAKVEDFSAPGEYDLAHSSNVVDHVDNPEAFVVKAHEVLRPGGLFMVSVHCVRGLAAFLGPLLKFVDRNHPHHFSRETFERLLNSVFPRVEVSYVATILEDQPDFSLLRSLQSPSLRAFKRSLSNVVLITYYFNCWKKE